MNLLDRRDFLRILAASNAGSAFLTNMSLAGSLGVHGKQISPPNRLTSFALLDDVVELATNSSLVPANTKGYIHSDFQLAIPGNLSRMGGLVRASEQQVINVIKREKSEAGKMWDQMGVEDLSMRRSKALEKHVKTEGKVALMMGWFMSKGIREVLEPVWSAADDSAGEMAVYQDMYVLRQLAEKSPARSIEDVEDLFLQMNPRMITRIHTLIPDFDDAENWTVRITDWRDEIKLLIESYARAYVRPEGNKINRYVRDLGFYDPDDAVIKAARNHRRIDLSTMADSKSLYAQALVKGVEGLIQGSTHL